MADIKSIGDSGAPREITPREKAIYKDEYKHGVDLFQRALQQHAKAEDVFKKGEFEDVMNNMMQVLNETARALKAENLKEQNKKIANDFAAYQDTPTTDNQKKLTKDLDQAKRSI